MVDTAVARLRRTDHLEDLLHFDYVSFQWIYDSFVVVAVFDVFVEKRVNNLNLNVLILDDLALIGARVKINYEVKH